MMTPLLVIITLVVYFILLYAISFFAGRKVNNQGFFVGNRQSSWYMVAFAMIGSSISGVTFISVPGMVMTSGFSYLQMVMGFVVGQIVIAFLLTPLFYKMNVVSIYEYLENRFGFSSYKTGAWFFFTSKMLGASVRLFLVCEVLQLLVFEPLELPFILNAFCSVALVWAYTFRGGVKTLIWTDSLKTFCLVVTLLLTLYFIASDLQLGFTGMVSSIVSSDLSRVFFFDDLNDKRFFFKQFLAGVFTMIAMTGLDQDMMQKNLSCRNFRDSQKNMIISVLLQFVIILLFLTLGVLLYQFATREGIEIPMKSDTLFPMITTQGYLPIIVGILFVVGLVSASYAAAGSALTALTTSFSVDILGATKSQTEQGTASIRKKVHIGMSIVMVLAIIMFHLLNNTSVIDAVYILASYTYGPILGLFAFGIFTKRKLRDRWVPLVAIASPILSYLLDVNSQSWFGGYQFSYELLLINALLTILGLCLISKRAK